MGEEENDETVSADIYDLAAKHYIWPLLHRADRDVQPPLILAEGEGTSVRDTDGNTYLDLMSGLTRASALGHSRADIIAAMHHQLGRLPYAGTAGQAADVTIALAAALADITPGDLTATAFSGSGSEANETAFKIARAHHQAGSSKPRAYKVISRWNAYHGATGGVLPATDLLDVRHPAEPAVPGFSQIPAPVNYRIPLGMQAAEWGALCADYLEREIQHQGPELVSAFIAETVMQANGVQIPPPEYLPRVQEICREYGVLFIADEVITGFGRTGALFGSNHWDLRPDIMTMAKAFTGGYAPLGATVISAELNDSLTRLADVHTFGGHATSSAAALEVVRIYEREPVVERARTLGATLLERLKELERYEIVGEVRGIGMWLAVDFTADAKTKAPLPIEVLGAMRVQAREQGVLVGHNGTAIELAPPLVIDEDEALDGLARFESVVAAVNKEIVRGE